MGGNCLEESLAAAGTSLSGELQMLPLLPKCCCLSGILSVVSLQAFRTSFVLWPTPVRTSQDRDEADGYQWDLLLDGVMPVILELVEIPCDPEVKFYALGCISLTLQQAYIRLQACLMLCLVKCYFSVASELTSRCFSLLQDFPALCPHLNL